MSLLSIGLEVVQAEAMDTNVTGNWLTRSAKCLKNLRSLEENVTTQTKFALIYIAAYLETGHSENEEQDDGTHIHYDIL